MHTDFFCPPKTPLVAATAEEFCYRLLTAGDLASKLIPPRLPDGRLLPLQGSATPRQISEPARAGALRMRPGAEPLPRLNQLRDKEARALCLERFAHHELQAIELFAWMLVAFPGSEVPPGLRRAFLLTLEEEQAHLALYLERLEAHGWWLGRSPLSDYLWQHHEGVLRSPQPALAFLSAMGLTFEQANLDFTLLYRDGFRTAGDEESAQVLTRVHREEIRHVRVAMHWLRRLKDPSHSELATYLATVPFPLSAARAKGRRFDLLARHRAGLPEDFIAHVRAAQPYEARQMERAKLHGQRGPQLLLWPNLGAEEQRPLPRGARGFLGGIFGAWAALFDATAGTGPPILLPPGEDSAQAAWRTALHAESTGPALDCLHGATGLWAWLGTTQAAAQAVSRGCPLYGPPPTVVHSVHDKAFAHTSALALGLLPPCLRELVVVLSPDELLAPDADVAIAAQIARWPAWTHARFILKPRHGTSGRGRLLGTGSLSTAPSATGSGSARPHAALAPLAERGGCLLEPWLDRVRDLSLQLYVHTDGRIEILGTTTQILTQSGQILGNRGVLRDGQICSGGSGAEEAALRNAATGIGGAAASSGFFGVAGIDAFVFRGEEGGELLRPVVELNARFTTGTIGVGLVRLAERGGLAQGMTAWALLLKGDARVLSAQAPCSTPGLRCVAPLPRGPILLLGRTQEDVDAGLAQLYAPRS